MESSLEIFYSYAHKDVKLRDELDKHLRTLQRHGLITGWYDRNISAGTEWERDIDTHLNSAHVILLLISPDFMASEYCYSIEMKRALERHNAGEARVIPIILRPVHWQDTPFGKLQALPPDAKPITKWPNRDRDTAFSIVAEKIREVVLELLDIQGDMTEADNLYKDQYYKEALALYEKVIGLFSDHTLAHLGKGKTLLAQKEYQESIAAFDKVKIVDLKGADPDFYRSRACALRNLQRYEESLAAYDDAIRVDPRNALLYNEKAELLCKFKRYHEALEVYEQAIRHEPNNPYCYHGKGKALFGLKSYEDALVAYDAAIRLGSPDPDHQFYKDKGVVYEHLAKQAYDNAKAVEWRRKLKLLRTLTGHSQGVFGLAISPNGKLLASGSKDKTIKLWNLQTGQEFRNLTKHSDRIWSVIFSPNGEFLASASEDKTIKLWNSQTGQETRTLNDLNSVYSLAISSDGKILASGSGETIKLWNSQTGQETRTLTGHKDFVYSLAISPDGELLASGSYDRTIKLWTLESGQETRTLKGHEDPVHDLVINPDGLTLASGSKDKTIKLWSLQTGQELRTLKSHSETVYVVAFSPDGQILVSGGADGAIKVWGVS